MANLKSSNGGEGCDPWTLLCYPSLSLSLFHQTRQCLLSAGLHKVFWKRVCTCAPASPSMSGHVIIRTSYHFLGYHSSLCLSPSRPSSQFVASLPPRRRSPLPSPSVRPWRTCLLSGHQSVVRPLVHTFAWKPPLRTGLRSWRSLLICCTLDGFCLASWHMRLKL